MWLGVICIEVMLHKIKSQLLKIFVKYTVLLRLLKAAAEGNKTKCKDKVISVL
jgi:hypothetical protein